MKPTGTLLLTRRDVASLLDLDRCIAAVEDAFRLLEALSRVRALQTAYAFDLDSVRAAEFAAAAVVVYEKAVRAGKGLLLDFAG